MGGVQAEKQIQLSYFSNVFLFLNLDFEFFMELLWGFCGALMVPRNTVWEQLVEPIEIFQAPPPPQISYKSFSKLYIIWIIVIRVNFYEFYDDIYL